VAEYLNVSYIMEGRHHLLSLRQGGDRQRGLMCLHQSPAHNPWRQVAG
jgi:hypothetical protein